MSKSRAKKKQRQRARAAVAIQAPGGAARGSNGAAERAAQRASARQAQDAAARHPSRSDERDAVMRPQPPWSPFPLTEIGMAVGIVLFGLGFVTGASKGPYLLTIGVLVLTVVVGELCLREHFAGFRSHSILLGLLPVTAVHMVVFYVVTRDWNGPVALAVDLAVAGALAYWLQRRFRVAQERAQLGR